MQDQILDMLLKKDEITWQTLIYDLVKTEQMDPWDIDISLLTKKYLETLRKLQEINFFISGKVVLAAAILLKIKSNKLIVENIANFDNQLFNKEIEVEEDVEEFDDIDSILDRPRLTIKTPLARKRKVSLKDLMTALEKALKVEKRRTLRKLEIIKSTEKVQIPEKKIDITTRIKNLYGKIKNFFNLRKETLTFNKLVVSDRKEDKIYTFIPLLYLANQEKVFLSQEIPFGEIEIILKEKLYKEGEGN